MTKLEVDEALKKHIGGFGRYQIGLIFLLIWGSFFDAWQIMPPVFTAYEPDHWCKTPVANFTHCTHEQQMAFSIPKKDNKYDSCYMFSHNYSIISEEDVCNGINVTEDYPTKDCTSWTYEDTYFKRSIVTDVSTKRSVNNHR